MGSLELFCLGWLWTEIFQSLPPKLLGLQAWAIIMALKISLSTPCLIDSMSQYRKLSWKLPSITLHSLLQDGSLMHWGSQPVQWTLYFYPLWNLSTSGRLDRDRKKEKDTLCQRQADPTAELYHLITQTTKNKTTPNQLGPTWPIHTISLAKLPALSCIWHQDTLKKKPKNPKGEWTLSLENPNPWPIPGISHLLFHLPLELMNNPAFC
jgi:hypothetical protein